MYLLEIELLKQDSFRQPQQLLLRNLRQGDYYFEKSSENNLLQELAKEFWLYQQVPSPDVGAKVSRTDCHHENLFQQHIQDSAQQLVTTLAQKPLTIAQILQQLEREQPEIVSLGKLYLDADILQLVDHYRSACEEWMVKEDTTLQDSL